MNDAEIKLQIIRLIDGQEGKSLAGIYELILSKLGGAGEKCPVDGASPIELGYREMSEDLERERSAFDWIENANNFGGL